jgi:universal stress protein A
MRKYETILVATDFSESAEHALEEATGLARRLDARIHLVHAYELPALLPGPEASAASAELDRSIRESARTALEELAERVRSVSLEVAVEVGHGAPTEVITRIARERGANLIVMGTRGRSGLSHVLLGSVAERTVRTAPCPVLTVKNPEEAPS